MLEPYQSGPTLIPRPGVSCTWTVWVIRTWVVILHEGRSTPRSPLSDDVAPEVPTYYGESLPALGWLLASLLPPLPNGLQDCPGAVTLREKAASVLTPLSGSYSFAPVDLVISYCLVRNLNLFKKISKNILGSIYSCLQWESRSKEFGPPRLRSLILQVSQETIDSAGRVLGWPKHCPVHQTFAHTWVAGSISRQGA